jgi:hypothetical protein
MNQSFFRFTFVKIGFTERRHVAEKQVQMRRAFLHSLPLETGSRSLKGTVDFDRNELAAGMFEFALLRQVFG